MRVNNCADCKKEIKHGEIMFPVYWSVEYDSGEAELRLLCKRCMQGELREPRLVGGRV